MIRLLCFLLGKPYETCKSCETLKEQLAFANAEKKQLTEVLLNIIQPKVTESAPVEINQIAQTSALFSRRRAALEQRDREEAMLQKTSKHLGQPDDKMKLVNPDAGKSVESLEKELGIEEEQKNG